MGIQSLRNMFKTANEYLKRHEEDNDRGDQDDAMKAILLTGTVIGIGIGLSAAGILMILVKATR